MYMQIGVDCGGTKTEAVILNKGKIVEHLKYNKPSNRTNVISIISELLNSKTAKKSKISKIGIGFAAPVINGLVPEIINVKDWTGVNIEEFIENEFNINCEVENDANCFVLAESRVVSGSRNKVVVGVTLGTGLGSGVVLKGKIYSGKSGVIGEIGRLPYKNKTIEDYTSKKFFLQNYNEDPLHIFKRAKEGKKEDIKKINQYSKHLGKVLAIICATWDPDVIVFGGSISNSFEIFYDKMLIELSKHIYKSQFNNLIIKKSEIKHSGAVGAALL